MPAFHFIAYTASGQEQKGTLEAENEKQARQLLRDKALVPISVRAVKEKKASIKNHLLSLNLNRRALSSKELALVTRQFATLLAAGLPLEEALLAAAEQTDKSRIRGIILSVRSKVLEGHALASALNEHPEAFSPLFCATIAAGEKTGHLDKVLLRLADYTEQQWHTEQKLRTALIYPSCIILVAIAIVGFLLEYVVPKMVTVYSHLGETLPWLTRVLIDISHGIKAYGLYTFLFLALAIYLFRYFLRTRVSFRTTVHHYLLRIPLIGYVIKTVNTARFSRTLAILSSAGVPMLEAMTISTQLVTNIPIKQAIEEAVARVREGAAIYLALKQTNYFPPMSIHMIASGEASGQLENMLERVAFNQEGEISRLIDVSLALFEPALILIMGVIVLFIVLAVLLPIFQLNQLTQ